MILNAFIGFLGGAVVAGSVLVVTAADDVREARTMSPVVTVDSTTPAVFDPPSDEELAGISHRKLRVELLQMAHADQVARSAGR